MPVHLLPPRYTQHSIALWRAAIADGWEVERLHGWQVPERLAGIEAIPYGETIFAGFVAERLSLALMEPPLDWLTTVPSPFLRRSVRFTILREAREETGPAFIKPADDKWFPKLAPIHSLASAGQCWKLTSERSCRRRCLAVLVPRRPDRRL
jgi:hypothetical protein